MRINIDHVCIYDCTEIPSSDWRSKTIHRAVAERDKERKSLVTVLVCLVALTLGYDQKHVSRKRNRVQAKKSSPGEKCSLLTCAVRGKAETRCALGNVVVEFRCSLSGWACKHTLFYAWVVIIAVVMLNYAHTKHLKWHYVLPRICYLKKQLI